MRAKNPHKFQSNIHTRSVNQFLHIYGFIWIIVIKKRPDQQVSRLTDVSQIK